METSSFVPLAPGVDDGPEGGATVAIGRGRPGGRKIASITAAVIVLAGAGVGIWYATKGGSSGSGPAVSVTTQKLTVTAGTMKQTVSASGTLEPTQDSNLTFAVGGTVQAVDVSTGQQVLAGQTLATIDPTVLTDEAEAAQSTLTADQDRLSSDQAAGASTSQIDSDQAALTSAQSQLSAAQTNLSDAVLKAPFSGTVASVGLAVGDSVSAGSGNSSANNSSGASSSSRSGSSALAGVLSALAGSSANSSSASSGSSTPGVTVISTGSFTVNTSVDDTEIGQLKVGDQAVIVPTGSTAPVYGTVASVGLIASSSGSGVASFPVVIAVTGTPGGLYAGSSASVSIIVQQLNDVVEVPTGALSYANGQATVTRIVGGSRVTTPVGTGITANGQTQITSGLRAGDVIFERVLKFNGATGAARSLFGSGGGGTGITGRGLGGIGRAGGTGGFAGFGGSAVPGGG